MCAMVMSGMSAPLCPSANNEMLNAHIITLFRTNILK